MPIKYKDFIYANKLFFSIFYSPRFSGLIFKSYSFFFAHLLTHRGMLMFLCGFRSSPVGSVAQATPRIQTCPAAALLSFSPPRDFSRRSFFFFSGLFFTLKSFGQNKKKLLSLCSSGLSKNSVCKKRRLWVILGRVKDHSSTNGFWEQLKGKLGIGQNLWNNYK